MGIPMKGAKAVYQGEEIRYHVTVFKNGWHFILNGKKRLYRDFDEVPEPIREKLAVLLLLEPGGHAPGVGRRMTQYKFWVY